jgi:hypothetical protein
MEDCVNLDNLILSPTGRPVHKIGDNAWAQYTAGDYCVSLEWYIEPRETEPIMVIWSTRGGRGSGAFGICLSSIGKYADPSGKPTREAFLECWHALPTLGRNQLDMEVFALLDVILRHTPDLIRMPPAPLAVRRAEAGEALLEITAKDEHGKTIDEALV